MSQPAEIDLDFGRYVALRRGALAQRAREGTAYSYAGERKIAKAMASLRPVSLAIEATVRLWKSVERANLLGSSVKVTDQQFPRLYEATARCASALQIAVPTVYVVPEIGKLNAHALGTDEDSCIVLCAALVDHLTDDELAFVLGHECGHIQNNHVVFSTALHYLSAAAGTYVRWIVQPALLALRAWSRRAEITCDRAGLLCVRDVDAATKAIVKLALGSPKLYQDLNVEEYLKQMQEGRRSLSRVVEMFQSHPYLPKRIEALRVFGRSAYYRNHAGLRADGLAADECDAEVAKLLSVL
ncbi:MAG: M48 family metallopeptidase [Pseudomonadota bacterium]